MNTKELCLGTLLLGDASGYEIKGMFESAFRHFQRVSYGSIYPALNALSKSGLVSYINETQAGRPDKKIYSITAAGRDYFQEVLRTAPPTEAYQSDFLVLVLFSKSMDTQRYTEVIETYADSLELQLKELSNLLQSPEDCLTPEARFTIEFGLHTLRAQLQFIRQRKQHLLQEHCKQDSNGSGAIRS